MRSPTTTWLLRAATALSGVGVGHARITSNLSSAAQSLFDYSMYVNDLRFDDSYKYIFYSDNGPWSVRFTAWYAAGLLYRNNGSDVENAKAAIVNIISCQLTESYDSAWYGTYKLSPDEPNPTPDSDLYPPSVYDTYDPNWREFIGTELVQIVEEFSDLLGSDLVSSIEDSLEIAAVGSMRRNGTYPEGDNLTPAYTNPAIMRAWYVGWIGARRNNSTFTNYANTQGDLVYELFKSTGDDTVAEYNAPTYYGEDIWALAGSIKYSAPNSTMSAHAPAILTAIWKDIGAHYNPYLANIAGPYDRANSRDLTQKSAVLSYFFWGLFGYGVGPQPLLQDSDLLYDVAQGSALALIMDIVAEHINETTSTQLSTTGYWNGTKSITKKIAEDPQYDPVTDGGFRTATTWISAPLMIGGVTVNETVVRGQQFVPAIVQWAGDKDHTPNPYMTFFTLYPTASTIDSVASANHISISYPNTTQDGTDIFTFAIEQIPPKWILKEKKVVTGLEELPCLEVKVNAAGLVKQPVVYGEDLYGRFYNVSYVVPANFTGVPSVELDVEYTC